MDPLRAPAVSVQDGRIVHFCSSSCRESHVGRGKALAAPVAEQRGSLSQDELAGQLPRTDSTAEPLSQPQPAKVDNSASWAPSSRSLDVPWRLGLGPLVQLGIAALASIAALAFAARPIVLLSVAAAVAGSRLVAGVLRERRRGLLRTIESLAVPVATVSILCAAALGSSERALAWSVIALLVAEQFGRLAELALRRRAELIHALASDAPAGLASTWSDNSRLSVVAHTVALWVSWMRYPVALGFGGTMWALAPSRPAEALFSAATALLALNPRVWRMLAGDAHLAAALAAAARGISIRDASALERLAKSRFALFIAKRALLRPEPAVVDWLAAEKWSDEELLSRLAAAERGVPGRFAQAICAFAERRGIRPKHEASAKREPGLGITAQVAGERLLCGERAWLLSHGVSTMPLEEAARVIESSGRRALFLAQGEEIAAVFGMEEQPLPSADTVPRQLLMLGIEPAMLTSAESDAGEALGARLGIPHVQIECSERELGPFLERLAAAGERVTLIGHGPAFEEHLGSAAVAVALGGQGPTRAGIDCGTAPLETLTPLFVVCRAADRHARANFALASGASLIGLLLALGWQAAPVVAFAGAVSFAAAVKSTANGLFPTAPRTLERLRFLLRRVARALVRRRSSSPLAS